MPRICEYECSVCDLALPEGWGYQFYVVNDRGEKIICYHARERDGIEEVLGRVLSPDLVFERTGFNSDCICLECLHQFRADLGGTDEYWRPYQTYRKCFEPIPTQAKDKRECPKCKSSRVKTELELVAATCPKCNEGVIEETWTGRAS